MKRALFYWRFAERCGLSIYLVNATGEVFDPTGVHLGTVDEIECCSYAPGLKTALRRACEPATRAA